MLRAPIASLFLVLSCVLALAAQTPEVRQWEPFEVTVTADVELPNPYVDGLIEGGKPFAVVTFTGADGTTRGMTVAVAAFWDGGRTWKARFAPPAAGQWSYSVSSVDALRGVRGTLQCIGWGAEERRANPTRHGFVRVATSGSRAGRHFEYADGTPFLWIGDTWWPWLKRGLPFTRARQVIDDRASRGFTVGQVMIAANSATSFAGQGFSSPNLDGIHDAERFIAYANSRGIVLWIMPWWGGNHLDTVAGPEKMRRWTRYMVHRLAAYNVIWNVTASTTCTITADSAFSSGRISERSYARKIRIGT